MENGSHDIDNNSNREQQGGYHTDQNVEIVECNGVIMIRKAQPVEKETPFSALDRWVSDNGFNDSDTVTEALEYVESIRQTRNNKDLKEW